MQRNLIQRQASVLLLVACVIGCSSSDDRYVELSQESMARQAEQNEQITRQSQQVAEAAHELVQADAQSRAELIEAQRALEAGIQAERLRLDEERDKLEQDRRELAAAKVREPIIANTISSLGVLGVVILPIILCLFLIRALGSNAPSEDLTELLVCELTTPQPVLLPTMPVESPRLDQTTDDPS